MGMIEVLLIIGGLIGTVIAVWEIKKSLMRDVDVRIQALTEFYANEKKDVVENIPKLMEQFGESMFVKIRGMIGGVASGSSRLEKGVQGALTEDLVNMQNPMFGALMKQFPALGNFAKKNPAAVPYIMNILQQFMGQPQGKPNQGQRPTYRGELKYG